MNEIDEKSQWRHLFTKFFFLFEANKRGIRFLKQNATAKESCSIITQCREKIEINQQNRSGFGFDLLTSFETHKYVAHRAQ